MARNILHAVRRLYRMVVSDSDTVRTLRQILPRKEALTESPLQPHIQASDYSAEIRPCCRLCQKRMNIHRGNPAKGKRPYWDCKPCGSRCMVKQVKPKSEPKTRGPHVSQRRKVAPEEQPCCIAHRCRMYGLVGDRWGCWLCDKKAPRVTETPRRMIPKLERLYPIAERPCCKTCKAVMGVRSMQTSYRWTCDTCDVVIRLRQRDDKAFHPYCIECHGVLSSAGKISGKKRWNCPKCIQTFYGEGKGREAVKIIKPTPEYLGELSALSEIIRDLSRRYSEQPFNAHLNTLTAAIGFQTKRNPERDRKAVMRQIDLCECRTAEEIAETVPLPVHEIERICHELVKTSTKRGGYEWRPVGANTDVARGPRTMGIFPVDAPTLVNPIIKRREDLDFYGVDRAGLTEVAGMVRRAARG